MTLAADRDNPPITAPAASPRPADPAFAQAGQAGAFSAWERSLALRYLRAKRKQGGVALISVISFIGITLAVAVLIIVMSVMNGFRSELVGKIVGFNGPAWVLGPAINGSGRDALIDRLKAVPGVVRATPAVEGYVVVGGPNQTGAGIVRGMRPADVAATPIIADNLKGGSLQDFGRGEYGGDTILIGSTLAENMGVTVGDQLRLISSGTPTVLGTTPNSKAYTVGAIFGTGMSQYDGAYIYMPLEQAQAFLGRESNVDKVEVTLDNPDHLDQLKPAIVQAAGPAAVVRDWRDQNHSFWNALQVEKSVMRLILMLIVAIAAANIISGLVMLVKNKGRDIAILRTMGASRGAILRVFFLSGAMIGVAATLTGLVLGALFCTFIGPIQSFVEWATGVTVFSPDTYYLSRIPARMELREVAIVTFWSLVMSFVATLPPAFRASRLDPVEALRYE